ncbi:MAG: hypothetical protein ACK5NY_00910 [Burkholderiaceae bacterium]|jgi:hypothetical protein
MPNLKLPRLNLNIPPPAIDARSSTDQVLGKTVLQERVEHKLVRQRLLRAEIREQHAAARLRVTQQLLAGAVGYSGQAASMAGELSADGHHYASEAAHHEHVRMAVGAALGAINAYRKNDPKRIDSLKTSLSKGVDDALYLVRADEPPGDQQNDGQRQNGQQNDGQRHSAFASPQTAPESLKPTAFPARPGISKLLKNRKLASELVNAGQKDGDLGPLLRKTRGALHPVQAVAHYLQGALPVISYRELLSGILEHARQIFESQAGWGQHHEHHVVLGGTAYRQKYEPVSFTTPAA